MCTVNYCNIGKFSATFLDLCKNVPCSVLLYSHFKEKVKAVCYNLQTCIWTYIFLRCNLTTPMVYLDMMNNENVTLPLTTYDTCSLSSKLEEKNYAKTILYSRPEKVHMLCVCVVCQLMEGERRAGSLTVYAGELQRVPFKIDGKKTIFPATVFNFLCCLLYTINF